MSEGKCMWHITLTSAFTNIIMLCGHKEFFFILCGTYTNIYLKDNINAVLGRDLCDEALCGVGVGEGKFHWSINLTNDSVNSSTKFNHNL